MSKLPEVLNKHWAKNTDNSVYIGYPSKYRNMFSHLDNSKAKYKVATRDDAVDCFEKHIEALMTKYPVASRTNH